MDDNTIPDTSSEQVSTWIRNLGIHNRDTGLERARTSREHLITVARRALGSQQQYTTAHLVFSGLVTRAVGLHEGAVSAIAADNPYAAFTLLRGYAENAAATLYLLDHPNQLEKFWSASGGHGVKIGKITSYAQRPGSRFGAFKGVYSELSQYAHPAAMSVLTSTTATTDGKFTWSSVPSFKVENDFITACAWVVELADANAQLLAEFPSVAW